MTKILIDEATVKLALEYIESVPDDRDNVGHIDRRALIASLQALAEQPAQQQEPVAFDVKCNDCGGNGLDKKDNNYSCVVCNGSGFIEKLLCTSPQPAQQEPRAWLDPWTQNNVTTDYDAYGKHGIPLYTSPPAQRTWVGLTDDFLQQSDYHLLHRFIETTEDDEGYDIGKEAVKRLAELGVVQSHGFGKYSVTMFGYWVHERYWEQNPSLPLKTNADRAIEAKLKEKNT